MKLIFEYIVKKKVEGRVIEVWVRRREVTDEEIFEKLIRPEYEGDSWEWEVEFDRVSDIKEV